METNVQVNCLINERTVTANANMKRMDSVFYLL